MVQQGSWGLLFWKAISDIGESHPNRDKRLIHQDFFIEGSQYSLTFHIKGRYLDTHLQYASPS